MLDVDTRGITTYVVIKNAHHSISRAEVDVLNIVEIKHVLFKDV